ncbi:MAG: OmpA family protein [Nitrococcus sp.]|nr:OmpA family protein [Nitrococcus sp.]
MTRIAALALTTIIATGCASVDPYTREQKTSNATKGALIGAVGGAIVGLATGDNAKERRNRALIGAGIGGLSGAAIGAYMDRQEAELRRRLENSGVSVTRRGDNILLNMPGNVTFALDSAALRPEFFGVLNSVALVLSEYDQTLIEIAGHTDSTGSPAYNQQLSMERAETVAHFLRNQSLDPRRFIVRGYGERYPIAHNDTAAGRQRNRRVELTLTPITASVARARNP